MLSRRGMLTAKYEVAGLANQVGRKEDSSGALRSGCWPAREAAGKNAGRLTRRQRSTCARSLVAVGLALEETGKPEEAALAAGYRASMLGAGDRRRQPAGGARRPAGVRRRPLCGGLAPQDDRPHGRGPACAGAGPRPPGGPRRGGPDGQRSTKQRLANSHHNLGVLLRTTGKPAEAEVECRMRSSDPAEAGRP